MVQPIEGLVVSVPVLVSAQCYERKPPSIQKMLLGLCASDTKGELQTPIRLLDLPQFLFELLALTPELWEAQADYRPEIVWAGKLPEGLHTLWPL